LEGAECRITTRRPLTKPTEGPVSAGLQPLRRAPHSKRPTTENPITLRDVRLDDCIAPGNMSERGSATTAEAEASHPERRQQWKAGPNATLPGTSWQCFDDDTLLAWLQSLPADHGMDGRLLEILSSDRHFYLRQAAAMSIRDPERLKEFAGDRHVGQILARRLSRAEDITYLSGLVQASRHLEVRRAAQAQLSSLLARLGGSSPEMALPPPSAARKT
jgi:hypothetical protein